MAAHNQPVDTDQTVKKCYTHFYKKKTKLSMNGSLWLQKWSNYLKIRGNG
jgi:hypothetical protein